MTANPSLKVFLLSLVVVLAGGESVAQDLCAGLVTDKAPHPMTALGKPGVGQAVTDPQFGTKIRRITNAGTGNTIKPMYSTIQAWNADETYLILYKQGSGHRLYDGKTYAFIRTLSINPADLEQVYWHTTDPDILFYVSGKDLIRYHVSSNTKETLTTFSFCSSGAHGGGDPMYISWDKDRIGLGCGSERFIYDMGTNTVTGRQTLSGGVPQVAPSGNLAFYIDGSGNAKALNASLNTVRSLDIGNPYDHASLGKTSDGHDAYFGVAFDPGPGGSGVGSLVLHDMTNGSSRVIVGPSTGYPYPRSATHVSAIAHKRPGWVVVSGVANLAGQGVLDNEIFLANTAPGGSVCRVAHHRSYGKSGSMGYWAEPHPVPSPSGTRILFGSDWGNSGSVDSYVIELPSYGGSVPPTDPPEIHSFSADPSTIQDGDCSTLSWSTSGGDLVTLDGESVAAVDSTLVCPDESTTYTLTAENASGSTSATTKVKVELVAPPPPPTTLEAASMVVDPEGNSVLEPGEVARMIPAWKNSSGASVLLTGVLTDFTGLGPPDSAYHIADGTASYGTVADGATASCAGDSYALQISTRKSRPAIHWDTTVTETLSNGQTMEWTVHVGDSFDDVPSTSPFYPFVETLLHNSVTSGCSDTLYCPTQSTTRAQMAVFMLRAKEGPGYSPPACGSARAFADVPVSSPFCPWIEELARRGIVNGCGGRSYCPSGSVTRAQMAVFVLKTLDPGATPVAAGTPMFRDVTWSDPFRPWIEELARRGIVVGCGDGNYCPTSRVTRQEMGVFIGKGFELDSHGP